MKSPLKALVLTLAVLIALPIVAWTSTFLYWHLKINRAIRELEATPLHSGMDGGPHPSYLPLLAAGCRSLPYLFDTITTSQDPLVLETLKGVIVDHVLPGYSIHPKNSSKTSSFVSLFDPKASSTDIHRRDLNSMRHWWEENRSKHNPWWKVWTSRCPASE